MAPLPLLPFQRLILDEILEEDALSIVARGLGLSRILAELSRVCATSKALVFLLHTNDDDVSELQYQLMQMRSGEANSQAPEVTVLNSEKNAQMRGQVYRQGGVICVTSQVLILDLLNDVVPFELVTGTVIFNASRVTAESTEAFILRILRQKSPKAFVKAFSDSPEHFTLGFAGLEKTLKVLGLRHVHLWPRFHVAVQKDLSRLATPVVEFRQPQTRAMVELQHAVLGCLKASISELCASTHVIDTETINVEASLFRYFDAMVKRQLDPYWHRLSGRVRGLANDLASLRRVAEYVTAYDCVSLQRYLDALLVSTKGAGGAKKPYDTPVWLESDSANILYSVNRARLFRKLPEAEATSTSSATKEKLKELELPETIEPVLEVPPKWELLAKVLDEIGASNQAADNGGPVLIMVAASRTCRLLRSYLGSLQETVELEFAGGPVKYPKMLVEMLRGFFIWKSRMSAAIKAAATTTSTCRGSNAPGAPPARGNQPAAKRRRVRGGSSVAAKVSRAPADSLERETAQLAADISSSLSEISVLELGLAPEAPPESAAAVAKDEGHLADTYLDENDEEWAEALAEFSEYYTILGRKQTVVVQQYQGAADSAMLEALQPSHVVMFDPDTSFVRQIEMYQAHHPGVLKQVSFMVYDDSLEEQRYLSALRREKESFEKLIHSKSVLVIPITEVQASPGNALLQALATRDHRNATIELPQVIVDAREFRSPLASLLHAAGYTVVPRTLEVGDYVLHDDLVVERKSLPDLVGSLRSGRLVSQVTAMVKHYRVAALLVEFEVNTSFSLTAIGGISQNISAASVSGQLTMLVLAFPRLRILWSSSPYETVEIFGQLKNGYAQPDADRAVAVGSENGGSSQTGIALRDEGGEQGRALSVLQTLPGITLRNYRAVAARFRNIRELCVASMEDLASVVDTKEATELYDFLHTKGLD